MDGRILFQDNSRISLKPFQLETAACPLCQSTKGEDYGGVSIDKKEWRITFCKNDSIWWVNPRPSATFFNQMYQDYFYHSPFPEQFGYASPELDSNRRLEKASMNWRDIYKLLPNLKRSFYFEIGCANGEMLVLSLQEGWHRAVGNEIAPDCVEQLKASGLEFFPGSFENLSADTFKGHSHESPSLIFADNVIEHLLDPLAAIIKCHSFQNKGDYIVFRLPDTQMPGPTLKLIDHTFHFTRSSFTKLMKQAGYEVVEIMHSGTFTAPNGIDKIENMTVAALRL